MRRYITISILFFIGISSVLSAQSDYGREIPLDDFPKFFEGYRIQVGAFSTEEAAVSLKYLLQEKVDEAVHLQYAQGHWRVRVGDFADSMQAADYITSALMPLGYSGSKMVRDKIKRIQDSASKAAMVDGFRVQVEALSDRAQALESAIKLDFNNPGIRVYVFNKDGLFRVLLGDFKTRGECSNWLDKKRASEGSEGWIVPMQVYVDPPPSPVQRPESDPFDYMD